MVNKAGEAPTFGDCAFRGVVGVVDIKMGDCPDSDVRVTVFGKPYAFSGKEFKIPVGSDMYEHISPKSVFKVPVGCKILVSRGDFRVVQDLTDIPVAP